MVMVSIHTIMFTTSSCQPQLMYLRIRFFFDACFSAVPAFPASLLFCFSAFLLFLLLCFSASLLFCFFAFLLPLLLCFSAFLLFCFSCFFASLLFLLLCFSAFPASLLFCFSAFLLFCFSAFPVSSLLCFSAFLIFWFACFSAFLLLCFSCFSLFCFSALLCFLLFQRLCLSCLSVSVPFCSYFCMPSLLIKTKMISPPFTKRINSLPSIYPPHAITRHHTPSLLLYVFVKFLWSWKSDSPAASWSFEGIPQFIQFGAVPSSGSRSVWEQYQTVW